MPKALILSLLIAITFAGSANCSDDPQLDQAIKLFNQKQYAAALPYLQKSMLSANPRPTPLYYAGLCYQYVGNNAMALKCYQVLCDDFEDSPEAKLARPALVRLITSAPPALAAVGGTDIKIASSERTAGSTAMPRDASSAVNFMRNYRMDDKEWAKLPDEVKVPFTRRTSSHLYLNGSVNGHPLSMMFDTGAEQCHFSKAQLQSMGVKIDPNSPRIPVSGVGGIAYCSMIMADVAVGDLERRIPVLVDEVSVGMPIIGETFFKEFRYETDNAGGFMRFSKKPRAGMSSHSYESTDVIAIPYKSMGDNMVVMAKVNGRSCPMIFDTGSFAICFSATHAASLGLDIPEGARMLMTHGAGGAVASYEFPVDRIELGPIIKSHIPVIVNRSGSPVLPLLGQPFYKDRRFTVDTENHLIKFVH